MYKSVFIFFWYTVDLINTACIARRQILIYTSTENLFLQTIEKEKHLKPYFQERMIYVQLKSILNKSWITLKQFLNTKIIDFLVGSQNILNRFRQQQKPPKNKEKNRSQW